MLIPNLQPLGIGEILDRAVTLFVRRFAVFVLIVAIVAIPVAAGYYITTPHTVDIMDDLRRAISIPPGHPAEQQAAFKLLAEHARAGPWTFVLVLVGSIVNILGATACMIAIAQAYAGRMPSVRQAYREALVRWLPQLVALIVLVGIGIVAIFAVFVLFLIVAFAVAAIGAVSTPAALIVGIPLGLIAVVVTFVVSMVFYLIVQMSLISIALEDPNPIRGIAAGFRRTLSRPILLRSVLVAAIAFVVSVAGNLVVGSAAGAVGLLTHVGAFNVALAVAGGLVVNVLVIIFLVVYSIDVRVRREGYDLSLAAQEPAS